LCPARREGENHIEASGTGRKKNRGGCGLVVIVGKVSGRLPESFRKGALRPQTFLAVDGERGREAQDNVYPGAAVRRKGKEGASAYPSDGVL